MHVRHDRNKTDLFHAIVFTANPGKDSTGLNPRQMYSVVPSFTRYKESLWSDSEGSHRAWKMCEHYKCSSIPKSGSVSVTVPVDYGFNGWYRRTSVITEPMILYNGAYGSVGELNVGLPNFYFERPDGGFVPPPADLESLVSHALKAMLPVIKAELSAVNSLIELKDFLSLRSSVEAIKDTIVTLFKKGFNRQTLAAAFRTKADVYLQYKFNIAPLLSDISGIYRSLANTERRINDFITRSGRVRISHFTRKLTESTDTPTYDTSMGLIDAWEYPEGPSHGTYKLGAVASMDRFVQTEPASFHVQMQYNYNYTAYQIEHARLLALLDALGINLNPGIIWNAIPWSFVVDWVFGVGQYLDNFKVTNMEPKINILRCLWSIKRKRRITVAGRYVSVPEELTFTPDPPASISLPVVEETAYRRQPFMPSGGSIESSGLTPTEFSLGAALVISRRRRPKRLRR